MRPTRDADLLCLGELGDDTLKAIFAELCTVAAEDGMEYTADTIRIEPIREEDVYGGQRVFVHARLGNARFRLQVDVGIGDAVTPPPEWIELPQLLGFPAVRLRAYRPETSIAEKLETILRRGLVNSRLKDYFDIYVLSRHGTFDRALLCQAVRATLDRRKTPIPDETPPGLTPAFAEETGRSAQWRSFLERVNAGSVPAELDTVVESIAAFLGPVIESVRRGGVGKGVWPPGGPWQAKTGGLMSFRPATSCTG